MVAQEEEGWEEEWGSKGDGEGGWGWGRFYGCHWGGAGKARQGSLYLEVIEDEEAFERVPWLCLGHRRGQQWLDGTSTLSLYGSLMGNTHIFNVLRPLLGLMAFLIQWRIWFTSSKCRFGWFWTLWKYWVVRLWTISILDPILPVALIHLFSCWSEHWYQLRFAFSQNVALTVTIFLYMYY